MTNRSWSKRLFVVVLLSTVFCSLAYPQILDRFRARRQVQTCPNCFPVVSQPSQTLWLPGEPVVTSPIASPLPAPRVALTSVDVVETGVRDKFHNAILKAVVDARRSGKINARQALSIRVRMLSPAFRQSVRDLAITQLAFSGDENAPVDDQGRIVEANIDWDGFATFLERIIPLIVQLIEYFGGSQ